MKKFYETPEFLQLQKVWYKKLKDSGFKDISEINHRSLSYMLEAQKRAEETAEYYDRIQDFLNENEHLLPANEVRILELHIAGIGIERIGKIIKSEGHKCFSLATVFKILHKLKDRIFKKPYGSDLDNDSNL